MPKIMHYIDFFLRPRDRLSSIHSYYIFFCNSPADLNHFLFETRKVHVVLILVKCQLNTKGPSPGMRYLQIKILTALSTYSRNVQKGISLVIMFKSDMRNIALIFH